MDDTRVLAALGVEHGRRAMLLVQANALVPTKLSSNFYAVRAVASAVRPLLCVYSVHAACVWFASMLACAPCVAPSRSVDLKPCSHH
jgi:hypothetical protein